MAEGRSVLSEKASLGEFVKRQTKYGTTTPKKHVDEVYVKHCIKTGETLQGIALSYGVTIEQIKRANKIWTNDSLFLYEQLLIPVPASEAARSKSPLFNGKSASSSIGSRLHSDGTDGARTKNDRADATEEATGQDTVLSGSDFFSKLDSSLAQIKSNVDRLEGQTAFPTDGSNPLSHLSPRRSAAPSRHRPRHADNVLSEPDLVFMPGRRTTPPPSIRTSLERLERQQDNIYEL